MSNLDRSGLVTALELELSDMVYQQHRISKFTLDWVIIGIQLFSCVITLILDAVLDIRVAFIGAIVNIILLIVTLINNHINTIAWNKSKRLLDVKIYPLIDLLANNNISNVEFHNQFADILDLNVPRLSEIDLDDIKKVQCPR